jgi:RNA polymerase sigma-70 factor (ECF subfamily)
VCGRSGAARAEQLLLDGLLADDGDAWREFDRRYSRLIERCIRRTTASFHTVGPEDLREIRATLWVQLLANEKRKLRSFLPGRGSSLSTWIAMLSIHCAYDYLRSLRREPLRVALNAAEYIGSPHPDPSEQCSARQAAARLSEALRRFSTKDQQFVQLYFGQGLGAEQVANRMGISVKTVYTKKHKIRQRLESVMAEHPLAA